MKQLALLLTVATIRCRANVNASPSSNAASPQLPTYDFDKMRKLVDRLNVIESSGPETILDFYDQRHKSFSIKPGGRGGDGERMCITSTCYALLTISLASDSYSSIIRDGDDETAVEGAPDKTIPIKQVLRALLASNCRKDDLFQIPVLVYTLLIVDVDRSVLRSAASSSSYTAKKLKKLIGTIISARPQRSNGAAQEHSDYIIYQISKVLSLLQLNAGTDRAQQLSTNGTLSDNNATTLNNNTENRIFGLPANALPDNYASDVFYALLRCNEVSYNELCRQLAYRTAGDLRLFDVIRLAYSLLTYIRSTESLSGVAGKEKDKGQGPSPDTRVSPLNQRLVTAALAAFFEEQSRDGLWDLGQPIYKTFSGGVGRNMGNAFVFPVNTVGSLLCALPAEHFRPHLDALEKILTWIEDHQTTEIHANSCDSDGNCYGVPLKGWASSHLGPGAGPQAWPTAHVLKCVSWIKKTVQQLMHNDVLEEFGGLAYSKKGVQLENWERLLDTDLGDPMKEGGCRTMKSVLEERIIRPFEKSIDNPSYGACYSCIFHGPPGTAKTTICEALAQRLGYDFVCIDTTAFLADGLSNVSSRIRYVFSRLMALKNAVILFDEIEEFALDRENKDLSMESRMLTTSMLTAINDLRRNKKSLFFVATNRLRAFDSAVIRPGRFDMQLFVGTPNIQSRVIQLEQKLSLIPGDKEFKAEAIENYCAFLESVWRENAMYMNYLEGLQFASACADTIVKTHGLSKNEMVKLFKKQAAVMTVRGSARDEYVETMELSRF